MEDVEEYYFPKDESFSAENLSSITLCLENLKKMKNSNKITNFPNSLHDHQIKFYIKLLIWENLLDKRYTPKQKEKKSIQQESSEKLKRHTKKEEKEGEEKNERKAQFLSTLSCGLSGHLSCEETLENASEGHLSSF